MLRFPIALLRNIFGFLWFLWQTVWYNLEYLIRRKKKIYVTAELEEDYRFGPPAGLGRWMRESRSFLELGDLFSRIADAPSVDGLVVETDGFQMGTARVQALTMAVDEIRESGKHVVTHLRSPTTADYLFGTAADDILVSPSDQLQTFGPRFDQFFAADVVDRLELHPQLVHIGDFKTAAHTALYDGMPRPQSAMMHGLHDRLVEAMRLGVDARRPEADGGVDALFDRAPCSSREAVRRSFVDARVFRSRIDAWLRWGGRMAPTVRPPFQGVDAWAEEPDQLEEEPPAEADVDEEVEPEDVMRVPLDEAEGMIPPSFDWVPLLGRSARVGVVDLTGMIVMSGGGLPGNRGPVVDPEDLIPTLREIRQSGMYDGLILHVNSPGGSAFASDVIWEELQQVRSVMPVAAYCTDVAASGGYYLAVGADHVVCRETTLTGSIGVVTGKISLPDLVERVGINVESIYDRDADTFTSLVHPLSDEMFERLNESARSFYRRFLQRVGQNRGLEKRRLHRYARGRVYLGEEAAERDLVDELGGLEDALRAVGEMGRFDPEETELMFVPHRKPNLRQVLGMQMSVESMVPEALVRPWMAAEILEREEMLALMPHTVDWSG